MNTVLNISKGLIFSLALFASASSNAWHGGGGGYHGGGGYYHGGGGYYHGGGWGGGWGGWGGGFSGVSVGIPLGGYYGASCYNQRVCTNQGCWIQQRCY